MKERNEPAVERPTLSLADRKEKRAAKRAKQREGNILRAAKMHVARIAWENMHRPDPTISKSLPSRSAHVGCSGWFYWHWRGTFYATDSRTADWFGHYAENFGTVELNAPFYSWPTESIVRSWISQAGRRRFIYTVKVCELITHVKKFVGTKTLIRDFCHIADLLGSHMGCFLFQLPPSFHYSPARLKRILTQLDMSRRNVVEFRHCSWWNENVFRAFRSQRVTFCSCSGPRLPDQLVDTADDIYIRFHGTKRWYRHDYTRAELTEWVAKIKESGEKRVWAYFNNDRDCYAIKNAKAFRRLLNGK